MVFSSVAFLFAFLPAVLAAYHLSPRRLRNGVLVLASLFFYTWGAGTIVVALIASVAANFLVGQRVEHAVDLEDRSTARRWLALGVVLNLVLLGWFKYVNFGVESWNGVLDWIGLSPMPWSEVLLPIGISFYTFHALSYLIDIYRGTARHLVSPIDFALYITFFPQLVAGPIVRFHEIRDQLLLRSETADAFATGIYRFALGLGKKVLIADTVAVIADAAFATPAAELSAASAWLGVVAYAVQLYFDFSGYSDMALGLALMFGIRLPENFNRPYASRSVTEFWRRWHMSLSRWFRDYLYVSLGGNRGSARQMYRNLVIVFLVTGLWHGANWTFVLWGAYHGLLLLIERVLGVGRGPGGDRHAAWQVPTVALVLLGWVLFRAPDVGYAIGYYGALLDPSLTMPIDVRVALDPVAAGALIIGIGSVLLPRTWVTGVRLEDPTRRLNRGLRLATVAVVLPAALVLVIAGTFSPFLYFQF
jgi:alginate O-acetyltransferase complex protein AlgI